MVYVCFSPEPTTDELRNVDTKWSISIPDTPHTTLIHVDKTWSISTSNTYHASKCRHQNTNGLCLLQSGTNH